LIAELERVSAKQVQRFSENFKLQAQKADHERRLHKASFQHNSNHSHLTTTLTDIQEHNAEVILTQMTSQIEAMTQVKEAQIDQLTSKTEAIQARCDEAHYQIRQDKQRRLELQRAVLLIQASTTYHTSHNLAKAQAQTAKKQKKLEILLRLLTSSRDHLSTSISHKTTLLTQTQEAARKMRDLTEQLIKEEQAFYEERDSDVMLTPPYLQVKRKPRE
jgi:hypothetical protein